MGTRSFGSIAFILLAFACYCLDQTGAHQAGTGQAKSKHERPKIVPVVVIGPGETKELLLSTWCTVGVTRSAGLQVGEMRDGQAQMQASTRIIDGKAYEQVGKVWAQDGVKVAVPSLEVATKLAGSPRFALLKEKGIEAFVLTISAASDAKPGSFEMHVADDTCNGTCDTDFRILVTNSQSAPNSAVRSTQDAIQE